MKSKSGLRRGLKWLFACHGSSMTVAMRNTLFLAAVLVTFGLALLVQPRCALALDPSEIALIVNSNEPAGRDLAQYYAQARHIPDNRILELSLPTGDEMPFEDFEETVVP